MKVRSFLNVFGNFNVKTSSLVLLFFLFTVLSAQQQPAVPAPAVDDAVDNAPVPLDGAVEQQPVADNPFEDLQRAVGGETTKPGEKKMGPRGVESIKNILVEDFESSELWYGGMFVDDGIVQVRKVMSVPKEVRDSETARADKSKFVLGAKVVFLRRTFSEASIEPPRKLRIPGVAKKVSAYVLGKGLPHVVYAVVRDMHNRIFHIKLGDLKHSGWKKLDGIIPHHLIQEDQRFSTLYRPRGLLFEGFLIKFSPLEALGNFYVYFDNLSFETDMYLEDEEVRMQKLPIEERIEPIDNW